jgi:predicted  nucleic acid-binding Zn-ribbon protein
VTGSVPSMLDPDEQAPADQPAEGSLQVLLLVQEHDSALDRLRHRRAHLPERSQLVDAEKELAALDASAAKVEAQAAPLRARQAELESAIEAATSRIGVIEKQLYQGRGVAYRDQQSMAAEVKSLQERRSHLEDEELEAMEQLEPLDASLTDLGTRRATIVAKRDRLLEEIETAEGVTDGEIAAIDTVRAHVVTALPTELGNEYEKLRAKLGGVGAAKLVGGSCSGCHLTLPATELDRIRHAPPGAWFHCDQCGRLLVP